MVYDLEKLLHEVIVEYGAHAGYKYPTIGWSSYNMIQSYGMYEYWTNHIVISNLLNNKNVSKETLKSVIYHEYIHQVCVEHDEWFVKLEKRFTNFDNHKKWLEEYYNSITKLPQMQVHAQLDPKEKTVLCLLRDTDLDTVKSAIYACNFNYYINTCVKHTLDLNRCNVIWLTQVDDIYVIVGWSEGVKFLKQKRSASLRPLSDEVVTYDCIAEIQKTVLNKDRSYLISKEYFPVDFTGMIEMSAGLDFDVEDMFDYINTYDCEREHFGFDKSALHSVSPHEESDYKKLLQIIQRENSLLRRIWIANAALKAKDCLDTRLTLAICLLDDLILDEAIRQYAEVLRIDPSNKEARNGIQAAFALKDTFVSI